MRWVCSLAVVLALVAPRAATSAEAKDEAREFFETRIRPVLVEQCYGCHSAGADLVESDLYLDSRQGLLAGGASGPALVPGDADASLLLRALRYEGPEMPPGGQLPPEVIADFGRWIAMGATDPRDGATGQPAPRGTIDFTAARSYWAFRPPVEHALPHVANTDWPSNEVDRFVLARLEQEGLRPVRAASRRVLIRRAAFDLTGLPPTPGEVATFFEDDAPDAFARVVDRLLASPRYGERWARHWLDVARYGEDQAHSFQPRLYPSGFRYRDWVIAALNRDMAYDRFVTEQIAGDLLDMPGRRERLPALGFFALGPVYYGDRKMFDQWDDRIDTLSRGLLGLTVACARCHDHKYDPIPTQDYYSLVGIIASSEYVEAPLVDEHVVQQYEQAQARIEAQQDRIDMFLQSESERIAEARVAEIARYMLAAWQWRQCRKVDAEISLEAYAEQEELDRSLLSKWTRFLSEADTGHSYLSAWRELIRRQDPAVDLSEDPDAWSQVREEAHTFQQRVTEVLRERDALQQDTAADAAVAATDAAASSSPPMLDEAKAALLDELIGPDGLLRVSARRIERSLPPESVQQLAELREELKRISEAAPAKFPFAHSLADAQQAKDLPVNIRGSPDSPGEVVPRRFLQILSPEGAPRFTSGSGRRELAEVIASAENPLTARVIVNRIWQYHFGRGIVATVDNFGNLGDRPTHPELLDYLTRRFIDEGWSIKQLHRRIMLSSTYQLSSSFDSDASQADPQNRWLWRMNRRRLEVEAWRDAMLAVSGNLDTTMGGPSGDLATSENRRRTLYGKVSRHDLDPLLRLFDFPDPNITSGTRPQTTVPLQQLFVLNSPFMVAQAKALAARLLSVPGTGVEGGVREAFRLVYQREPTAQDLERGRAFLTAAQEHQNGEQLTPWEQYAQVLLAANEFMYVD